MNFVLTYLTKNWSSLNLEHFGDPKNLISVLLTPRFKASTHLIFFIMKRSSSQPIIVAKVPRLEGNHSQLEIEVSNLNRIQGAYSDGFDSIPRVLAFEDFNNHRLLIETAVAGQAMRPEVVRSQRDFCIEAVYSWLINLQLASKASAVHSTDWFERLIEKPLADLANCAEGHAGFYDLVEKTRDLSNGLRAIAMPLVCEHGDLSSPNILITGDKKIGVVDWELAEPQGLPAVDLFFFLTYIAFAVNRVNKNKQYLKAFQQSFFSENTWTNRYIDRYIKKIDLQSELLKPLFVLCWSRYVANIVTRLKVHDNTASGLNPEAYDWLLDNRYYKLWKYTLLNMDKLRLCSQ